jgi:hypothetical protein
MAQVPSDEEVGRQILGVFLEIKFARVAHFGAIISSK